MYHDGRICRDRQWGLSSIGNRDALGGRCGIEVDRGWAIGLKDARARAGRAEFGAADERAWTAHHAVDQRTAIGVGGGGADREVAALIARCWRGAEGDGCRRERIRSGDGELKIDGRVEVGGINVNRTGTGAAIGGSTTNLPNAAQRQGADIGKIVTQGGCRSSRGCNAQIAGCCYRYSSRHGFSAGATQDEIVIGYSLHGLRTSAIVIDNITSDSCRERSNSRCSTYVESGIGTLRYSTCSG